ncbi:hypothetical protein ACRAWC_22915 [Leifsonia sp. L25]|uniref:hypothetical protein n=1 Tax=Leifsonia sp. L25 TaxID=3423957 RepID=UPI003D68282B
MSAPVFFTANVYVTTWPTAETVAVSAVFCSVMEAVACSGMLRSSGGEVMELPPAMAEAVAESATEP